MYYLFFVLIYSGLFCQEAKPTSSYNAPGFDMNIYQTSGMTGLTGDEMLPGTPALKLLGFGTNSIRSDSSVKDIFPYVNENTAIVGDATNNLGTVHCIFIKFKKWKGQVYPVASLNYQSGNPGHTSWSTFFTNINSEKGTGHVCIDSGGQIFCPSDNNCGGEMSERVSWFIYGA